jgi:hypothetical protein
MVFGDINSVEPPYTVTVINIAKLPEPIKTEVTRVADAVTEARREQFARTGEDVTVCLLVA